MSDAPGAPGANAALDEFTATAPLVLVGCGNMGGALLGGWLKNGLKPRGLVVVDPKASSMASSRRDLGAARFSDDAGALVADQVVARALVLAVKPQVIGGIIAGLRGLCGPRTLVLSIIAGKRLGWFRDRLGADTAIVRAMPNTPAAVGAGVSGLYAPPAVAAGDRALSDALMAAVGRVVALNDESEIDLVTATSGSGPAYFYFLIECLAAAGEAAGLSAEMAAALARETAIGTAAVLRNDGASPSELRRRVTSPKGTTEAALEVLAAENEGLGPLMRRTVEAALQRANELSSGDA